MKFVTLAGLACAAVLAASGPCMADGLMLSVVQDPGSMANLGALQAGQTITLDVNLSGLDVPDGATIGTLEGTVAFDSTLLGTPTSPLQGPIVPDPTGFLVATSGGVADATYSNFFSDSGLSISANGTFYTFSVTVQPNVAGSGVFSLNPANGGFVDAFDSSGNPLSITAGPDLAFTVVLASVPEPATLLMMAVGLTALLGLERRRRHRALSK